MMKLGFWGLIALLIICMGTAYVASRMFSKSKGFSSNAMFDEKVWVFETNSPIITTPILVNENIIARTNDEIFSLNKNSGEINWQVQSKAYNGLIDDYGIPRQLAGNAEYLIAGEESNSIGIYSTTTGRPIWTTVTDLNFINRIEIIDNLMIVARHNESLTVFDLDSKQKLWTTKVPDRTNLSIVMNSRVVVLAADRFLQVYDLKSGELLETATYPNAIAGELLLDGSTLFLIYNPEEGIGLTLQSLQLDTLAENWTYHVGAIGHPYLYVADDKLYVYDQSLLSLDKDTGILLWQENTQNFYSKPVAYDGRLYFTSREGIDKNLCKVEIANGELVSGTTIGKMGPFGSGDDFVAPLVVDNLLIVSHNAEITAYRIAE